MSTLKKLGELAPRYVEFNQAAAGAIADTYLWTSDDYYELVEVREVHNVAGTDAGAVTADIEKDTGTTAIGSGTSLLASTFDLKSTANTEVVKNVTNAGLITSADTRTIGPGDRLALNITGTPTALAGTCLVLVLKPKRVTRNVR